MNQCYELQDIDLPSFSLGFEDFQPPSFSLGIDDSQQTANPNAWQTSDAEDHGWVNVCKGPKLQKDAGECAQGIVGKREAGNGNAADSGNDDDDFELFRGEIPRRSFKRLRRAGSGPKKGCKSSSPAPVFNVHDPSDCSMKNGGIQILSPTKESDVFADDIEDFSSEGEALESSTHVPRSYLSLRPSQTPPTFEKSSSLTVGINAAFASTSRPSVSVKKNSLGSKEVKLDSRADQQDFGALGTKTGFSSFSSFNANGGSGSSTCTMRPSFSKIHSDSFYGDLPKNWNSTPDSRWRDNADYGEALQGPVGNDSLNNFATYTPGTRKCFVGANNTWTPPSTITAKNDCLQVTSSKIFANSSNSKGKSYGMEIHTPSLGGEKIVIDDNDDDDADIQVAASGYKTLCHDEQIDALLKARFPHFTFVDSLQSMHISDPVYIDYRGQFGGKEATSQKCMGTPKQKNDRSWSRVRKAVPKPRAQRKVTGSQAQIGDTAGFSGRKGHWLTDNGRKVYVAQDGQRLTGRAAYRQHVKDSGRQKRKTKKQKVRKK